MHAATRICGNTSPGVVLCLHRRGSRLASLTHDASVYWVIIRFSSHDACPSTRQVEMLTYLSKVARGAAQKVEVLVHVVKALFDINPNMATHLNINIWKRCVATLLEVRCFRIPSTVHIPVVPSTCDSLSLRWLCLTSMTQKHRRFCCWAASCFRRRPRFLPSHIVAGAGTS